jgi:hypothetical protein
LLLALGPLGCGRLGFDPLAVPGDAATEVGRRSVLRLDRVAPGELLVDYPLLVVLDDTRADRTRIAPDGGNLRFADATGAALPFEIERLGAAGGPALIAWVRVPTISGLTTTLTVSYATAPGPRATAAVWSDAFVAVWHLGDSLADAAAGHATIAQGTTPGDGAIGGGRAFRGATSDYLAVADAAGFTPTEFTLSAWVWPTTVPTASYAGLVTRQVGMTSDNDLYLGLHAGGAIVTCETATREQDVVGAVVPPGAWSHLVGTATSQQARLYVDGAAQAMGLIGAPLTASARPVFLGADRSGSTGSPAIADGDFLDGRLDEVRIERVARSAAWIGYDDLAMRDGVISYGPVE